MMNEQIAALKSADEYLVNLSEGISNVAGFINDGKIEEACGLIPAIAEGLDWIMKVVVLTKEVQKEEILTNDIHEYLDGIVEALESEDYILVGDLFNYEILPILYRIHGQIKEILR